MTAIVVDVFIGILTGLVHLLMALEHVLPDFATTPAGMISVSQCDCKHFFVFFSYLIVLECTHHFSGIPSLFGKHLCH